MNHKKIWIIGLPRTATTSVCQAMLGLGYKTAHTCYTQTCLNQAQVIADTPIFYDYPIFDQRFAGSKFINLTRELTNWLPSIRQLLLRMHTNLQREDGGFNPYLKRCFNEVFKPLTLANIQSDDFLKHCYQRHQDAVQLYFTNRPNDLLTIDVSDDGSFNQLLKFLEISPPINHAGFLPINMGGKVTAWNEIKHPLKIASTRDGKIDKTL
ncbi:sulfotransferase [Colwellia sp. MEBiC06753]